MRTLIAFLLSALSASAAGYVITWDANDPGEHVTNYVIYVAPGVTNNWSTNYSAGTNTIMTLYPSDAGTGTILHPNYPLPWESKDTPLVVRFGAKAVNGVAESDFSNFVYVTNKPGAPKGMKIEYKGVTITARLESAPSPVGEWVTIMDYSDYGQMLSNMVEGFYRVNLGVRYEQ